MPHLRPLILIVFALAIVSLSALPARADICSVIPGNLVNNCGFETGDFTGWISSDLTNSGVVGTAPNSGNFEAFFGSSGGVTTLTQDISTVAGTEYTVSFYLRNFQGVTPNSFNAFFDGVALGAPLPFTNSPAFGYTLFTFTVVATDALSTLRFEFVHEHSEWFIDDISVTAVPEPATMLLLGTGLLGVTAGIRRHRRAKR